MAETYPIKGIPTQDPNGRPYVRKDIDQWYREQVDPWRSNGIQLTLFVHALAAIQKRTVKNKLSYFRLAGIHSAPWCPWDGEYNSTIPSDDSDRIPGFCVHNNYTFPTWHRVYMLLYEQVLHEAMMEYIDIHRNIPDKFKDQWKKEANQWRLPYWDFARFADRPEAASGTRGDADADRLRLPILCMMPTVRTIAFDQEEYYFENRPNPLYKYVTPKPMGDYDRPYKIFGEHISATDTNPAFTYPWDECSATTKYGILDGYDKDIWSDGGQNWLRANYALNEHSWYDKSWAHGTSVPTLQDMVYRLFQYGLDSWGAFSTTRYKKDASVKEEDNAKNAMSLEFIHNNIHNWVGGTQFLRPEKENIHLWGAGHMSSVFMAAFDPIFFIYHCNIDRLTAIWQVLNPQLWFDDDHSKPTKDNDLSPFHKDNKRTFYKSDDVRDWRKLHYEYEILQGPTPGTDRPREDILNDIATLYGTPTKDLYGRLPEPEGSKDDYIITVIYDKYALNGASFKINIFLGDVLKESFSGSESENFVASVYNFSSSLSSSGCGNCHQQKAEGVKCIAQVPATVPIRHHIINSREAPEPVYVVLNSLGKPVRMDADIQLHKASRAYFKHCISPDPSDPLKYELVKHGRQADEIFE